MGHTLSSTSEGWEEGSWQASTKPDFESGWTRALANQGGLMLLTNIDVSIDPITVRMDGAVVNHLVNMILHPITGARTGWKHESEDVF
jgi:hypothetical protein